MLISKLKEIRFFQVLTLFTRYLIGCAFVFASFVKIRGERFTALSGAAEPINSWMHYFETMYQSGIMWNFIGWSQLIAGFLLITQRFASLGAVLFFPIILNIMVVTISYSFGGTAYITTLMFLANIYLLLWDWDKLKVFINLPYLEDEPSFMKRGIWAKLGFLYFAVTLILEVIKMFGKEFTKGTDPTKIYVLLPFGLMVSLVIVSILIGIVVLFKQIKTRD